MGRLDGLTLVRFALQYDTLGGVQKHLKLLNRILLERNRITIIQMYFTTKDDDPDIYEESIGRGRMIIVPISMQKDRSDTLKKGLEGQIYRLVKHLLVTLKIKDTIRSWTEWLFTKKIAVQFEGIPLVRRFYIRNLAGINVKALVKRGNAIFDKYRVDLLTIHYPFHKDGAELTCIAKRKNIPVVLQHHGDNALLNNIASKELISMVDRLAVLSGNKMPTFIKSDVTVLYSGVETSFFNPLHSKHSCNENDHVNVPVVLLPGYVCSNKGHMDLLQIARTLRKKKNLRFKIIFAGDFGPHEFTGELKKKIEKYNLTEDVLFTDRLQEDELRGYYAKSDVVVLPSRTEGIPRVILEAQLMEKPVVAYDVGGVSMSMIDGVTGYLIKKGDKKGFGNALYTLLHDENLRHLMGKAGRKYVKEKFSLDAYAERHEDLYLSILSGVKKPAFELAADLRR